MLPLACLLVQAASLEKVFQLLVLRVRWTQGSESIREDAKIVPTKAFWDLIALEFHSN
jgi:hypothetical protein